MILITVTAKGGYWGYDPRNGPSTWPGTCGTGNRQSPIDIRSIDVDYAVLNKLHFVNYLKSGPVKLQNNGHTSLFPLFIDVLSA